MTPKDMSVVPSRIGVESYCYCKPEWSPWHNDPIPRKKENKHRVAIVNGRLFTECDSGRCRHIRNEFRSFCRSGTSPYPSVLPGKIKAYAAECFLVRRERYDDYHRVQDAKVGADWSDRRNPHYVKAARYDRLLRSMIANRHSESEALEIYKHFYPNRRAVLSVIALMNWMDDGRLPQAEFTVSIPEWKRNLDEPDSKVVQAFLIPRSLHFFGELCPFSPRLILEVQYERFGPMMFELCSDGQLNQLNQLHNA